MEVERPSGDKHEVPTQRAERGVCAPALRMRIYCITVRCDCVLDDLSALSPAALFLTIFASTIAAICMLGMCAKRWCGGRPYALAGAVATLCAALALSRAWSKHLAAGACSEMLESQLVVQCNSQGWGNRIGWWLTAAAVGKAVNKTVVTHWPGGSVHGGYDWRIVNRVVGLPSNLLVDVPPAPGRLLHRIPFHPRPYTSDYVPEPAWEMLGLWNEARVFPRCVGKSAFLRAYRAVQKELRPKLELCLPKPATYAVIHLRRGDRLARGQPSPGLGQSVLAALRASGNHTWLVLSDDHKAGADAETQLRKHGLALVKPPGQRCVRALCAAVGGCAVASSPSPSRPNELPSLVLPNTLAMLRDFFAVNLARGVVVSMPQGDGESSFSTVAALAGDVPMLFPYLRSASSLASWEQANDGGQVRGVFFLDDLAAYSDAVRQPSEQAAAHVAEGRVGVAAGLRSALRSISMSLQLAKQMRTNGEIWARELECSSAFGRTPSRALAVCIPGL